ncbi:MAG: DUF5056 domain-containing protein [Bacteroides sp.]|nr:DUF5056 domain-containing protein [Bacteroides sp.]
MNRITDDELVKQFLANNKKEVADKGFTERVMKSLPEKKRRNIPWLSIFMSIIVLAVMIYANVFSKILNTIVAALQDTYYDNYGLREIKPEFIIVAVVIVGLLTLSEKVKKILDIG